MALHQNLKFCASKDLPVKIIENIWKQHFQYECDNQKILRNATSQQHEVKPHKFNKMGQNVDRYFSRVDIQRPLST